MNFLSSSLQVFHCSSFHKSWWTSVFPWLRIQHLLVFQNIYHSIMSPSDWDSTLWNVHRQIIISNAQFISAESKIRFLVEAMETPLHRGQPLRSPLCVLCCPVWQHLALTGRASPAGHSKTNWWMHFLSLRSDRNMRGYFTELILGNCGCLPAEDKPLSVSTAAMKHSDVPLLTPIAADQALSCF